MSYDDLSSYPQSIAEIRASKAEKGGSEIWSVRDVLVSTLRDIDAGVIAPESVAVVLALVDDRGTTLEYRQRCNSTLELIGMLSRATIELSGTRHD